MLAAKILSRAVAETFVRCAGGRGFYTRVMLYGDCAGTLTVRTLLKLSQGLDIYWRDSNICPTEEEYCHMVQQKTGSAKPYRSHKMFRKATKNRPLV